MTNRILELKRRIREKKPLIHCITNPISINDCANAVLAVGAKPIMAEHPREVSEITAGAKALCCPAKRQKRWIFLIASTWWGLDAALCGWSLPDSMSGNAVPRS